METTRKNGFSDLNVAIKGGSVGGKVSRRPRNIKIGDQLTSEEMLFMAEGIAYIITNMEYDKTKAEQKVKDVSHLLMIGDWHIVFTQTLDNPISSLSEWKKYLLNKWKSAYGKIVNKKLAEGDDDMLRSLRNVSRAYDVSLNTKTQWVKEAKARI